MQSSNLEPMTYGPRGTGRKLVPTDDDVRAEVARFRKRLAHRADRRAARAELVAICEEVAQ